MKKLPDYMDNPIDNILVNICDNMCDFFHKTGHTPNMLTTYSLIFGLISCYFLDKRKLLLFSIFYFISYFFDCADGYYARKYSMTSKFGDMYDHIKDISVFLLLLFISFKNARHNITIPVIILISIFIFLSTFHLSCQEKNCNEEFKDKDNNFFRPMSKLCYDKKHIYWSRYFGTGSLNIFLIGILCYINRN